MKRLVPLYPLAALVSLSFFAAVAANLYADNTEGIVQVTVVDVAGNPVPDAPVYVSAGRHLHLMPGEKTGVIRFSIPEGDYTMSSSVSTKTHDAIDRFASLEAPVHVVPGDTVSVFLTLYPLGNPIPPISLSTLHKMGIDGDLASNINN